MQIGGGGGGGGVRETYANRERVSKGGGGGERTYVKQGGWKWGEGYLFVYLFVCEIY